RDRRRSAAPARAGGPGALPERGRAAAVLCGPDQNEVTRPSVGARAGYFAVHPGAAPARLCRVGRVPWGPVRELFVSSLPRKNRTAKGGPVRHLLGLHQLPGLPRAAADLLRM